MHNVVIVLHVIGASLSLTLGAWQLVRRAKGDRPHRRVGRLWVALMYWTVLSSFAIKDLDPGHFSWIHGLSVFTFVTLTIGTVAAVRGNIETHRRFMTGSYYGLVGAFLGAVAVPQRVIPQLAVNRPLVFSAAVVAVAVASAVLVMLYGRPTVTRATKTTATTTTATTTGTRRGAEGDPLRKAAGGAGRIRGAGHRPVEPLSAGLRRTSQEVRDDEYRADRDHAGQVAGCTAAAVSAGRVGGVRAADAHGG